MLNLKQGILLLGYKALIGMHMLIYRFGLLHFIAAFKLAKYYKWKELLSLFMASYLAAKLHLPEQNVELWHALGLGDTISGTIRHLVNRKKELNAVRCISMFKMECEFPQVPLLEAFLKCLKEKMVEKLKKEISIGKVHVAKMEFTALHDGLYAISKLNLQSDSVSLLTKQWEEEVEAMKIYEQSLRKHGADPIVLPIEQQEKRPRIESHAASCSQSRSHSFGNHSMSDGSPILLGGPCPASNKPRAPANDVPGANYGAAQYNVTLVHPFGRSYPHSYDGKFCLSANFSSNEILFYFRILWCKLDATTI